MKKIFKVTLIGGLALALTAGGNFAAFATEPIATQTAVTEQSTKDKAAIRAFRLAKADYRLALAAYKLAKQDYASKKAAYKLVMDELREVLKAYGSARKQINRTFADAIAAAKATYEAVLASDATASEKLSARDTFNQAKAAAAAARAAAIAALGPAPVRPAAPVKPSSPEKPVRP